MAGNAEDPSASTLSRTTLDPGGAPSVASLRRIAALTIACHPDLDRIGDRAPLPGLLAGQKVSVSRVEPGFASGEPLRDAYLSREPIVLSRDPGGIRIDRRNTTTRLEVDGEPIDSATWIAPDQLERGVVIDLSGRITLVLHTCQHRAEPASRHGMLGDSDALLGLLDEIGYAAAHTAPVLVRGPSGSGKELVARAIHGASSRAAGPYVSVNVAAIPEATAAAELFGYKKGAFTGAAADQPGWFGRAEGGTLFLDEIGEAPDAVQPMLLRALESGEVQPVGAQGVRRVDVRVVAATDADLEASAEAGRFRFPLLQRLAGHTVRVPPLAARRADVGVLLRHFLLRELELLGLQVPELDDADRPWLSAGVVSRALRYDWPGNVRELANFARELVLANRGRRLSRAGPSFDRLLPAAAGGAERTSSPALPQSPPAERRSLGDAELVEALRAHRWRVGATARALGISKNTLYQLMERAEGIRKARDLGADEIALCQDECGGDTARMAERLQVSERGLKLRMRELGIG